jgi:hypothetical protein
MSSIDEVIQTYNSVLKVAETNALRQRERVYGGIMCSVKDALQEHITEEMVKIAWQNLGGTPERLDINSRKIHIPIRKEYVDKIEDDKVRKHIMENIVVYHYGLSVDKHIFIDDRFIMGIECKAFTENAMIKRILILIDFHLLKTVCPQIVCFLFQLESQLGGD